MLKWYTLYVNVKKIAFECANYSVVVWLLGVSLACKIDTIIILVKESEEVPCEHAHAPWSVHNNS
jgi:hypothetical protein